LRKNKILLFVLIILIVAIVCILVTVSSFRTELLQDPTVKVMVILTTALGFLLGKVSDFLIAKDQRQERKINKEIEDIGNGS
jgi:hypothetical protein